MSLSATPASSPARWKRSPRITCRWGTLRPFESLWMLGQKLAALNYVAPQMIDRVAFNREYVGRKWRVTANLSTLAANLGCDAHTLEPFDPRHLFGIPDTQRLEIFRGSELRFCPVCLRLGFHSEIFQLRGLQSCPQHGCRLRTACPGCQRWLSIDEFLPALTCRCGYKLSAWTPQADTILAEKRLPKLEAFGHALRTHAALDGRAKRTFVLGLHPERVSQESVLDLWTQANQTGRSAMSNLPCGVRQFDPQRYVSEALANLLGQQHPLSSLYWSIDRSILRRFTRGPTSTKRMAAFEYWQFFWTCTRGRTQMPCPVNISTDGHESRLRTILLEWAAWRYRYDSAFESILPAVLILLLVATLRESWRQCRPRPAHYTDLDAATVLPILFVNPFSDARNWVASTAELTPRFANLAEG
jgi:hypothetical protein